MFVSDTLGSSHDGEQRRRLIRLAVMLAILIGVMIALSDLATRLQQRIGQDLVTRQVELLDRDPMKVQQFVRDQIQANEYQGSLRGPVATLWAGAGNEIDRAFLLMTMLQECGEEAQLARSGETWWVDSPAVLAPAGVTEADWHGTMIPSDASVQLELTVSTASAATALSVLLPVSELSSDPLLLEMTGSVLSLRRASQKKPLTAQTVAEGCTELQITCTTVGLGGSADRTVSAPLQVFQPLSLAALTQSTTAPVLVGMLIPLTATPPAVVPSEGGSESRPLFEPLISIPFQEAASFDAQRFANPRLDPNQDGLDEFVRYYLVSIPPLVGLREDYTAEEFEIYYSPQVTALH